MKSKFWTSEKLLSLTALLVSLLTLVVFVYQTSLIRQQQYMSVYPYLSLGNEFSGTLKYRYVLSNEGIGPAFIESVELSTPNSNTYDDFIDYVDQVVREEDSIWYFHSNLTVGRLISPNESISLIQLVNSEILEEVGIKQYDELPNTYKSARKLYDILNADSLLIKIVYSSVYGEKWILKGDASVPARLD